MTTPRDDIAGLSERLREVERAELDVASQADCRPEDTANYYYAEVCHNAAAQLDALLKERDALQARVKELEDGRNFWKSERDRIKAFLSEGDWQTVKSEQAWRNRALRAEQERDEAYERLKPFAAASDSLDDKHSDRSDIWESPSAMEITAKHLRAARDLVRRLAAGPKKEGK